MEKIFNRRINKKFVKSKKPNKIIRLNEESKENKNKENNKLLGKKRNIILF